MLFVAFAVKIIQEAFPQLYELAQTQNPMRLKNPIATMSLLLALTGVTFSQGVNSSSNENSLQGPTLSILDSLNPLPQRFTHVPDQYKDVRGMVMVERSVVSYSAILPYVFFDSASSKIPDRYVLFDEYWQTLSFSENMVVGNGLHKYYHLLNVVGHRLRYDPEFAVGIVGNNSSGLEESDAGETLELSEERGRVVYNYLRNVWQIPEDQLQLLPPRNLPRWPENRRTVAGREGNRRVEIIASNSWVLRRPIVDTGMQVLPFPASIQLRLQNGIDDSALAYRVVEFRRNGELWHRIVDSAMCCKKFSYSWTNAAGERLQPTDSLFTIQLVVYRKDGREQRSPEITVPLLYVSNTQTRQEFRTDRVLTRGLMLSGFQRDNATGIGPVEHQILQDVLEPTVNESSIIEIIVGTHNIGLPDRSLRFSEVTAGSLEKYFLWHKHESPYTQLKAAGTGQWSPAYSNATPEGRFLNRLIEIRIDSKKNYEL